MQAELLKENSGKWNNKFHDREVLSECVLGKVIYYLGENPIVIDRTLHSEHCS